MEKMKIDLVVTRHPGLVEYLHELGMCGESVEIISHASPEAVTGRHVCGVLPHSLSCLTASFTEIPLALPAELRGAELTLPQVRQYAGAAVTYRVVEVPALPVGEKVREFSDRQGNRDRGCYHGVVFEGKFYGRQEAVTAKLAGTRNSRPKRTVSGHTPTGE